MLTKKDKERIIKIVSCYGEYDTRKYRYKLIECSDHTEIRRMAINSLGYTVSFDDANWELIVKNERES